LGVVVWDDKLFAVGGQNTDCNNLKSGEYLDLKNVNAGWKEIPDMDTAREDLGVAVWDGKLFAVGGQKTLETDPHKSGEYLDLKNVNAGWTKIPDMSTGRYSLGVAFADGKLFAVGGHDDGKILKSGGYLRVSSHRYQN